MDKVGPLLCYIIDKQRSGARVEICESTVDNMAALDTNYYLTLGSNKTLDGNNVYHKLVKIARVRGKHQSELPLNALISAHLGDSTLCMLAELMLLKDFNLLILAIKDDLISKTLERCTIFLFLAEDFITAIRHKLRELRRTTRRQPHRCALEVYSQERPTRHDVLPSLEYFSEKVDVNYWVLYVPEVEDFPLVDGFSFVESNPMTLVGLRMTTAGGCHTTTTSTVRQFTECLAAYFNGREKSSRELPWEVVCERHADRVPIGDWQRCDVVNSNNVSDDESREMATFWEEKVRQYQVSISPGDFGRDEALRSVE
ncbi:retrotransposon hot spot (RHS) protein, putative [Trypanosoma cruzi marinkellei]|uniref:Retrotransposon hot spot (RHS) protein, putative n=1 Tax=Trypanosoma cruzi marinkellei TaxID=85056 RepID=K2NNL5_TRYCR|nr:retrotransposon hot spot (RHS) protein, putative [Trypanosoma cruzi marinkellei]